MLRIAPYTYVESSQVFETERVELRECLLYQKHFRCEVYDAKFNLPAERFAYTSVFNSGKVKGERGFGEIVRKCSLLSCRVKRKLGKGANRLVFISGSLGATCAIEFCDL